MKRSKHCLISYYDYMTKVQKDINKMTPILRKHGITKAALFGSGARNELTKKSDLDLLVHLPNDMTLLGVIALKMRLERVVKRKVDLVEYKALKNSLRPR